MMISKKTKGVITSTKIGMLERPTKHAWPAMAPTSRLAWLSSLAASTPREVLEAGFLFIILFENSLKSYYWRPFSRLCWRCSSSLLMLASSNGKSFDKLYTVS